jgi:hypothetical protein
MVSQDERGMDERQHRRWLPIFTEFGLQYISKYADAKVKGKVAAVLK